MDGVEELWMQKLKKFNVEIPDMTFEECYNDLFEDCYNYSDLLDTLFLFSNNYYMYPEIYQMKLLLIIWVQLKITFPEDRTIVNNTIKAIYQSETEEFKKARTELIRDKLEADNLISCDDNGKEYIIVYRGVNHKSASSDVAISWTYNIDVAKWFANRFACLHRDDKCCRVIQGKIYLKDILSIEHSRQEDEIIAFPHKVFDISEVTDFVAKYDYNGE